MTNMIQPNYKAGTYHVPTSSRGANQAGAQAGSFLNMAMQASQSRSYSPANGLGGITGTGGMEAAPANQMMNRMGMASGGFQTMHLAGMISDGIQTMHLAGMISDGIQTGGAEAVEAPSLEAMLKAKYPNLVYHVFDASSSNWRTRNDYPHYLLYESGDKAKETLENWEPVGENPFYGSIDGRFTAPAEIHALGNVPPGSKAVVIHPKVQERMEQDPAYAREIMAKIDTWFSFDLARNEAIRSGSTAGMSQAVAIGEDGNICNAVSSSSGGEITYSSDEVVRAYRLRMARRADFMRWLQQKWLEESIQDSIQDSMQDFTQNFIQDSIQHTSLASSTAAKSQLAEMINSGKLREIFGDEIAGVPTETVLSITQAQVWGNGIV